MSSPPSFRDQAPSPEVPLTVGFYDSLLHLGRTDGNGGFHGLQNRLVFDRSGEPHDISIFTDSDLDQVRESTSKLNVAWMVESPEHHRPIYERMDDPEMHERFDLVLTFDEHLLRHGERFTFLPAGVCWILPPHRKIYEKSRQVSIIASQKNFLSGHRLRHAAIERFGNQIDGIYGRRHESIPGYEGVSQEYEELADKVDGLKDFRYSIVIENCRQDFCFTEKLIDSFATGTIPIYWGCPSIGKFFDESGIISFETLDELEQILATIGPDDYAARLPAVERNFQLFDAYARVESYLYEEVILKHPAFRPYLPR